MSKTYSKKVKYRSLSFNESYNRIMKKGQMVMLVRFWDSDKDGVQTRYLDSSFIGKASANDIYEKFTLTSKVLDPTKLFQVFDRPNVNLAFLDLINDKRKEMEYNQLIHIGAYRLRTLHSAFLWC